MDKPFNAPQAVADLLSFAQQYDREDALVAIAHVLVINLCRRRETLPETLDDVRQVFEQIHRLCRWNYGNLRDLDMTSKEIVYYFGDPEKIDGAASNETVRARF